VRQAGAAGRRIAPVELLSAAGCLRQDRNERTRIMPILLWLLGVPISVVLLLMLFGVIGF
jgi:hypothetical protein